MSNTSKGWLRITYVSFAFCAAFFVGGLKGLLVGPVAALILILGNVGVILALFPAHVSWTVYTLIKTNRFDTPLKVALLFALPALFGIWLGLSIAGSVLVGLGYGFFTPWVSAFEAFRDENESRKFLHCLVDGTWGTIKGSCTVVRDFADICYHSFPLYLKELRESPGSNEVQTLRLIHVPGCIVVGIMGLIVEIPLYTIIAVVKSPYMLFKGWQRLIHDLISREGPFLETACIPIAGLTILLWPLVVIGSILMAIFSSFFIGLYGSVIVYQERSFRRGVAYVIAMIWGNMMRACEIRGKELLDAGAITPTDLDEWLRVKNGNEASVIGIGLPCYSFFHFLLHSIKVGSGGLLLLDGTEITYQNRPQDRLIDWFFHPVMVLKEQIKVIKLSEGEVKFLEKIVLYGNNSQRMEAWENGSLLPQDALRVAQIQGISRRMMGLARSVSKFPTYRRKYRQLVKALVSHSLEKESISQSIEKDSSIKSSSVRSVVSSIEIVWHEL
ncbi:hypothetical protein RJ641_011330 [Dillenia turbinata]|uniref:Uncharacterized protein n=1 Tax=Dillenia turbinata TaxID=194707 RepID=A0AAN8Z368_9MAGN